MTLRELGRYHRTPDTRQAPPCTAQAALAKLPCACDGVVHALLTCSVGHPSSASDAKSRQPVPVFSHAAAGVSRSIPGHATHTYQPPNCILFCNAATAWLEVQAARALAGANAGDWSRADAATNCGNCFAEAAELLPAAQQASALAKAAACYRAALALEEDALVRTSPPVPAPPLLPAPPPVPAAPPGGALTPPSSPESTVQPPVWAPGVY